MIAPQPWPSVCGGPDRHPSHLRLLPSAGPDRNPRPLHLLPSTGRDRHPSPLHLLPSTGPDRYPSPFAFSLPPVRIATPVSFCLLPSGGPDRHPSPLRLLRFRAPESPTQPLRLLRFRGPDRQPSPFCFLSIGGRLVRPVTLFRGPDRRPWLSSSRLRRSLSSARSFEGSTTPLLPVRARTTQHGAAGRRFRRASLLRVLSRLPHSAWVHRLGQASIRGRDWVRRSGHLGGGRRARGPHSRDPSGRRAVGWNLPGSSRDWRPRSTFSPRTKRRAIDAGGARLEPVARKPNQRDSAGSPSTFVELKGDRCSRPTFHVEHRLGLAGMRDPNSAQWRPLKGGVQGPCLAPSGPPSPGYGRPDTLLEMEWVGPF